MTTQRAYKKRVSEASRFLRGEQTRGWNLPETKDPLEGDKLSKLLTTHFKRYTEDLFWSPEEAKQYGYDIDPGSQLKWVQENGGFAAFMVSPPIEPPPVEEIEYATQKQFDILIKAQRKGTLNLKQLTRPLAITSEQAGQLGFDTQEDIMLPTLEPAKGALYPTIAAPIFQESQELQDYRLLYEEYQRAKGGLGREEWLRIGTPLRPELEQSFKKVFPEEEVIPFIQSLEANEGAVEQFWQDIREIGRTPETEGFLTTYLGVTEEDLDLVFPRAFEEIAPAGAKPRATRFLENQWGEWLVGEVSKGLDKPLILVKNEDIESYILDNPAIWGKVEKWQREHPALTTGQEISILGGSLLMLPQQWGAAILQATQGFGGASVVDRDWADEFISDANTDMDKFVSEVSSRYADRPSFLGIAPGDIASVSRNIGYSLTSMGVGLAVGLPTAFLPVPGARVAAWTSGAAASGAVAYQMTTYQITQTYLELMDEEKRGRTGEGLTRQEEDKLKDDFADNARKYGLWEAIPEAVSNLAFAKLLTAPLTRMIGRSIAGKVLQKVGGIYGEELLTETITQKGQSAIEVEVGLREGRLAWTEAFKEVAPQTFLLTTILGGMGQVSVSSVNRIKKSLKNEIGEEHPLYKEINNNITEDIIPTSMEPELTVEVVTPEAVPAEPMTRLREEDIKGEIRRLERVLPTAPTEEKQQISDRIEILKRDLEIGEELVAPEVTTEVTPRAAEYLALDKKDEQALTSESRSSYEQEIDDALNEGNAIIELRRLAKLRKNKAKAPQLLAEAQQREGELKKRGVELRDFTGETYVSGFPHKVVANTAEKGYAGEIVVVETLSPAVYAYTSSGRLKILKVADVVTGEPSQVTKPEPVTPEVAPAAPKPTPEAPEPIISPIEVISNKELQEVQEDSFVDSVEEVGEADDWNDILGLASDSFNAQAESAGLPPPNIPPGTTGHIDSGGNNSENDLYDMVNRVIPGEDEGRAAVRVWDGTRRRMATEAIAWWKKGNQFLKELGVGKADGINQRLTQEDSYELFKSLHGEGGVPANLQPVYDDLKVMLDQEAADMLAFDPTFSKALMAHPDYFPRGWRPPREGRVRPGAKPGFLKPRVDASFVEMVETGWEPISWNPYDMLALRRMAGTEYREGRLLIGRLKTFGKAISEKDAPKDGWRVPKVGPAFEGKPYVGSDGTAFMTPKIATPNRVADVLESIYGVPVEFRIAGVDIFKHLSKFGAVTKRAKLFGSLFQHLDFLTRDFFIGFTPEGIRRGLPIKYPALAARVTWSAISPTARANLETRILSGDLLYNDSTISLKMIADSGWLLGQDELLIRRDVRQQLESAVKEAPDWNIFEPIQRRLDNVAKFFEAGLFDGVYRESQAYALEHVIVPRLKRMHPQWTDQQIAGDAASIVNTKYSTLAVWQSVLQQPAVREFARTMFFSANETESWVRQATGTVVGKNKTYWTEYAIATFIALAIAANTINLLSEGEPLPPDRYMPFVLGSSFSSMPFGVAYNDKFMSPKLPWDGRNGQPIYLDLVGQADTFFRWILDPGGALTARYNVFPRAMMNQVQGKDFWGREFKNAGDRARQVITDLFMPIGAGNFLEATRQKWPPVGKFVPEAEGRIGITGALLQVTGLNVRGQKTMDMLDGFASRSGLLKADGTPVENWDDLEPNQRRQLEKNPELQQEMGLRSIIAEERQYPGAVGFGKLDVLDQERITRGEALVGELTGDLKGVDRAEAFNIAKAFRGAVSQLKKEIADKKSQVSEDFKLFKETGVLPEDPLDKALVEYYNIFDKSRRASGVMDWEKVNRLEVQVREKWTKEQEVYVDRNIGLTEWGPLTQEYETQRKKLGESGYWDTPESKRKLLRSNRPEVEEILTGKFYNYKPLEPLEIKHQEIMAIAEGYGDKESQLYITDDDERKVALEQLRIDNPQWVDDMRRIVASNKGASDVVVEKWVDRGHIVDEFTAGSSEAMVWLLDNPDVHRWALDQELLTDDGSDWNEPVFRLNAKWREQDDEYNSLSVEGDARERYLTGNEEYRKDRRRRDAYGLISPTGDKFPESEVENYVAYYELPTKGFRQERFLDDNPEFARAMHDINGMDLPDYDKVPSEQYDDIYDQWPDQFDELDGLADNKTEYYIEDENQREVRRRDLRFTRTGEYTEFGLAELKRKAYKLLVPDEMADNYVDYYSITKPRDWELRMDTNMWFEDDWFLIEHKDFYTEVYRGLLELERKDWRKVPTRGVFDKYVAYLRLPQGKARQDYRLQNLDLDEWGAIRFGWTSITMQKIRGEFTPQERLSEEISEMERRLRE